MFRDIQEVELFGDEVGVKVNLPTFIRKHPLHEDEMIDDELLRFLHRAGEDRGYDLSPEELLPIGTVMRMKADSDLVTYIHPTLIQSIQRLLAKKNYVIDTNFLGEPRFIEQEHALLFEVTKIEEEE